MKGKKVNSQPQFIHLINIDAAEILECKKILKNQILQPSNFNGFEEKYDNVLKLMERTVWNGDSNSALLIGPPGSGKTTLVRSALEELSQDQKFLEQAVVVTLNGLIHTDDRLALKAISRQMSLENMVEDRVTGTFADNLLLLLGTLKNKGHGAVLFVLEEMSLFCSHHNQTLLYNLFDIAHSNQASICVLGVTCRLDVLDLMEKRVKSRFSHRQVLLMPQANSQGLEERLGLCRDLLTLQDCTLSRGFVSTWNKHVGGLLTPGSEGHASVQRLFSVDSREQATRDFLLQVVCCLDVDHPQLLAQDFTSTSREVVADDRLRLLGGLSVLELSLVIAMNHLASIYQGEPLNFEMVYARYLKFANQSTTEASPREVILKAFEHLQAMEIILPVTSGVGGSRTQREYQLHHFQMTSVQVNDLVKDYTDLPEDVKQWASSNVL